MPIPILIVFSFSDSGGSVDGLRGTVCRDPLSLSVSVGTVSLFSFGPFRTFSLLSNTENSEFS